jgi:hypothetical protein
MLDGTKDDELIRQAAIHHSVEPEILSRLLALAPEFENFNIYGAKSGFTREVARILDGFGAVQNNDTKL